MEPATLRLDRDSAIEFLYGRINYERTARVPYRSDAFKLDTMRRLLDRLGNPHEQLKVVHLAGTKGKGSTAMMIATMLTAAGYKTALYTSPHLDRLEERLMIDGAECPPAALVELVNQVRPIVDEMDVEAANEGRGRGGPTFFEITTAMAMLHFVRRGVDIAVLEVGLGGRLDSTNVCRPLVSVITSISFDHTKTLGNTLRAIAREKAGIIKQGVSVISGVVQPEPRIVIEQTARQFDATLYSLGADFIADYETVDAYEIGTPVAGVLPAQRARIHYSENISGVNCRLNALSLGMLGRHQAANAAVAICTLNRLRGAGWRIDDDAIRAGIARARCPARIEVFQGQPTVVIDSAHNVASVEALVRTLNENFAGRRRVLLFSASRDKDSRGMLRTLLPQFDSVILTRYLNNPRSVPPEKLLRTARQIVAEREGASLSNQSITICPDPRLAWESAHRSAAPEDLVCVTGSIFIAAETRPLALQSLPQVADCAAPC